LPDTSGRRAGFTKSLKSAKLIRSSSRANGIEGDLLVGAKSSEESMRVAKGAGAGLNQTIRIQFGGQFTVLAPRYFQLEQIYRRSRHYGHGEASVHQHMRLGQFLTRM
jgi:hypothetical protein